MKKWLKKSFLAALGLISLVPFLIAVIVLSVLCVAAVVIFDLCYGRKHRPRRKRGNWTEGIQERLSSSLEWVVGLAYNPPPAY